MISSIWDTSKLQLHNIKETQLNEKTDPNSPDNSPEDSPQDEEPPYKALNTVLKRLPIIRRSLQILFD